MVHLGKQLFTPVRHALANGGHHRVARQEVAGGHGIELTATAFDLLQCLGNIGVILETVIQYHLPAVVTQRVNFKALVQADPGHFVVAHRHKQVVVVQHLVVLEVVQHGVGNGAHLGGEKHSRALNTGRRADKDCLQKAGQINGIGAQLFIEQAPTVFPGQHQGEDGPTNSQREPATVKQLEQVGRPEGKVHRKEEACGANAQSQRVVPAIANHVERQHGGDQHVGAHGNTVGRGQIAGRTEHHDGHHNQHKQTPINEGKIDLAGIFHAGVLHL